MVEKVLMFCNRQISHYCGELKHINIRGCTAITDEAIAELCIECKKLMSVNVKEIPISVSTLQLLRAKRPLLNVQE